MRSKSKIDSKYEVGPYRRVKMRIQALERGETHFRCTVPRPDNKSVPFSVEIECGKVVEAFEMIIGIARSAYYPDVRVIEEEGKQKRTESVKKPRYAVEVLQDDVSGTKKSSTKSARRKSDDTDSVD